MRGSKVKTMRRVARETGLPVDRDYRVKMHRKQELVPTKDGTFKVVEVQRPQIFLGRCQRRMVQILKRKCPKNSFFGVALSYYRTGGLPEGLRKATITIVEAPAQ